MHVHAGLEAVTAPAEPKHHLAQENPPGDGGGVHRGHLSPLQACMVLIFSSEGVKCKAKQEEEGA